MKHTRVLFAALVLAVGAQPVFAQVTDDELEVTVTALPAIMAKLPPGPSAIVYNDRTLILSQRLAAKLGRQIDHEQSRLVCRAENPPDNKPRRVCSLKDGISLVNLTGAKVAGERGQAYFTIEIPSNSPWNRVESTIYVVDLVRSAGKWTVKGVRLFAIS